MNRWKVAFFVMVPLWLGTVAVFLYSLVDGGVTQTYMSEGYADCEAHRDFLHAQARGRLTRDAMRSTPVKVTWSANDYTRDVEADEFELKFDKQGRYVGSRFGASQTKGFD
jgi:hypothetical protein